MIITTGKIVKVDISNFQFERSAETPGLVTVVSSWSPGKGERFSLPANEDEADRFIMAYRRVIDEQIEYRKKEQE